MLPNLERLQIGGNVREKRQKWDTPPCHDELRYEDGEILNFNPWNRQQGVDAKFYRYELVSLNTQLATLKDMLALNKLMTPDWEHVLRTLYSKKTPPPRLKLPYEGEAFVEARDNEAKPQYYLKTIKKGTTLSHIQPRGVFWTRCEEGCNTDPVVGDKCYTDGFLWTNPSPDWSWINHSPRRVTRVRVNIPADTQVIIDRAPVMNGVECQFDNHRESRFPDVLLSPAEFRVTSVTHYRSTEETYNDADKSDKFKYVKPVSYGPPSENDIEYAQKRVFDAPEFMDVRMDMVAQLKLPSVDSLVKS